MRLATLGLAGLGSLLLAGAALAHHSFAMFDPERTLTLEGTIADFVWTNPHSWIMVNVENAQGANEEWAIEMGGPAGLARSGWSATTLTPGMPVSVLVRPHKDGSHFGQFMAVYFEDGTMMGNPDAPPSGDAGGLAPR
jgi:hypothetical protein